MRPFKMNKMLYYIKLKVHKMLLALLIFFKHYSKLDRISFYLNHPYKKL
jgi:hypothetical protein